MKQSVILLILAFLMTSCLDEKSRSIAFDSEPLVSDNSLSDDEDDKKEDKKIERPDLAVILNSSPCACSQGKSLLLGSGSCVSFCSGKTHNEQFLYVNVTLKESITFDDTFQNLTGWCSKEINGVTNPSCLLYPVDEDNNELAPITLSGDALATSFKVDISSLANNKIYRITLKEVTSGASSTTIQIKKITDNYTEPALGPVRLNPVTQYTCLARTAQTQENSPDIFYTDAVRYHFYFIERNEPDPLPVGLSNIFCHDIFLHGDRDQSNFDRLEETPGTFTLWDHEDPRFYDLDKTGERDIHELLKKKVEEQGYTLAAVPKIFNEFKYPGTPVENANAGNQEQVLGMVMTPFYNSENYRAYCPTSSHYYGNVPILVAMRDLIAVDTEAIYIGQKEKESYVDENGDVKEASQDFIIMRESQIKKIWFYYNTNNLPTKPTESNISQKKILFFYPPDYDSPYVKKSHQRVYVVKSAQDIKNASAQNNSAPPTELPMHDKRVGCVPVTSDD